MQRLTIRLTAADAARVLEHARKQQAKAVDGGGTFQQWSRVVAALRDAGAGAAETRADVEGRS